MKNLKTISILSVLMLSLLIGVNNSSAATLAATLKGRILLQVEQNGEAWYVNPVNELRYYLGRPADAFNIMRELGLGISNKDFDSFNGYAPSRLSGRILLKVADSGKAYYVNTNDLKMYYLGRPADAFNVMRELGLGITDKNLSLIGVADNEITSWKEYRSDELVKTKFELAILNFWQVRQVFRDPQNKNKFYYVTNFDDGSDIWVYDLSKDKTYQQNGTFNIPEGNTLLFSQKLAKNLEFTKEFRGVGIVSNKFVFVETYSDDSPGPCFSPWLYSNLEYIDLGVSKPTRKSFTLLEDLKRIEEQKAIDCQKNL